MPERSSGQLKLSFDAKALSRAGQAFDESWAAIAANYSESEKETARTNLATIILGLAADKSRDMEQVKAAALEFFTCARHPATLLH